MFTFTGTFWLVCISVTIRYFWSWPSLTGKLNINWIHSRKDSFCEIHRCNKGVENVHVYISLSHCIVAIYWVAGFHWVGVNSIVCVDIHLHVPLAAGTRVIGHATCWSRLVNGTIDLAKETRTVWSRLSIAPEGKNKVTALSHEKDSWTVDSETPDDIHQKNQDFNVIKAQIPSQKRITTDKRIISFFLCPITSKK